MSDNEGCRLQTIPEKDEPTTTEGVANQLPEDVCGKTKTL
jgi:hypothetical protein